MTSQKGGLFWHLIYEKPLQYYNQYCRVRTDCNMSHKLLGLILISFIIYTSSKPINSTSQAIGNLLLYQLLDSFVCTLDGVLHFHTISAVMYISITNFSYLFTIILLYQLFVYISIMNVSCLFTFTVQYQLFIHISNMNVSCLLTFQ